MESIQQQITTLAYKVDLVYQMLDRSQQNGSQHLDPHMVAREQTSFQQIPNPEETDSLEYGARRRLQGESTNYGNNGSGDLPRGVNYRHDTGWVIAQQDMLIDSHGDEISPHQTKEQDLSPQVQIQRLTAQLTAAYNRIAALEEQLLAKRWK